MTTATTAKKTGRKKGARAVGGFDLSPLMDDIKVKVLDLFDQLQAGESQAVELAHQVGVHLVNARDNLGEHFPAWLAKHITPTLGMRQVRKYLRLAGRTHLSGSHWGLIQAGVKAGKFGVLSDQYPYTINGVLRYLTSVIGGKKGRKMDRPEKKRVLVRQDYQRVLRRHGLDLEAFTAALDELGIELKPAAKS